MTLVAGAAEIEITPAEVEGVLLGGFGFGRRATGLHEPLFASALYLELGDESLAIVSVDCVGLLRSSVDEVRRRQRALSDARRLLVCATHTHASPDTIGFWGPSFLGIFPRRSGRDPTYMDVLHDKLAMIVDEAKDRAGPAALRVASYDVDPVWTRNDRIGGGRYDGAVALRLDGEQGAIATLLNFASHPEALWDKNTLMSPDFVGAYRRRVRELGGGVPLFINGPLGAMLTPNVDPKAGARERRRYIDALGTALANEAVERSAAAPTDEEPALSWTMARTTLENANWRFKLLERLGFISLSADAEADDGDAVITETHRVRLGDLLIVTVPGELAPEVGERWRAAQDVEHFALFGLCQDELGYILSASMFDDREYRYETTMSLGPHVVAALESAQRSLAERSS